MLFYKYSSRERINHKKASLLRHATQRHGRSTSQRVALTTALICEGHSTPLPSLLSACVFRNALWVAAGYPGSSRHYHCTIRGGGKTGKQVEMGKNTLNTARMVDGIHKWLGGRVTPLQAVSSSSSSVRRGLKHRLCTERVAPLTISFTPVANPAYKSRTKWLVESMFIRCRFDEKNRKINVETMAVRSSFPSGKFLKSVLEIRKYRRPSAQQRVQTISQSPVQYMKRLLSSPPPREKLN